MKDKHSSLLQKSTLKSHQGMPMKVLSLNLHSLADLSMIMNASCHLFRCYMNDLVRYLDNNVYMEIYVTW